MIAYCEGFIVTINEQIPPAVLLTAYEMPKYDKRQILGRPIITAQEAEQLPALFKQAINAGLIDPDTYKQEQSRLLKNHGLVI